MKEKSQFEKNAADKQVELLSGALSGAVSAGGHWLNATGKGYPKFYPAGVAVSPFNALLWLCTQTSTDARATSSPYIAKQRQEANPSRNTKKEYRSCSIIGTST